MSSRPLIQPFPVIEDGDMSADITSDVTIISNTSMVSYSYVWTGTSPVGEIVVEVSDDYAQNAAGVVSNAGNWTALPLSDSTDVSGNSGTGFIDIDAISAYAIRTRYVRSSGTGTLNCIVKGKVM